MIKKDQPVHKLDLTMLFDSMQDEYASTKEAYDATWGKKKKTMVILFFLLIFPGLIYWMFVWKKGFHQRAEMANKFIANGLAKMSGHDKSPFNESNAVINSTISQKRYPLPMGNISTLKAWGIKALTGNLKKNSRAIFDSPSVEVDTIANILLDTNMIAFLSEKRSSDVDGTIGKELIVKSSSKVGFNVDGTLITVYNLQTVLDIEYIDKDTGSNKPQHTKIPLFTGVIASINASNAYKGQLLLKSKKWKLRENKLYKFGKTMKKVEHDLASEDFNDHFKMFLEQEDGVALRKTFQPRTILSFIEAADANKNMLYNQDDESGVTIALESNKKNDLPLYIEKVGKFFKNSEHARVMLADDLQPLVSIAAMIKDLKDDKFYKATPGTK